jgi:hypothetical protein
MLLGHDFKVAYDREELDANLDVVKTRTYLDSDDLEEIIVASKPCKQRVACIYCAHCGEVKEMKQEGSSSVYPPKKDDKP